jgi:cephalosporin-C deacetylase-like acetyl esterase
MGSLETHSKLAGFNLLQTHYKQVGDHAIRADFIIPRSTFTGKRPVIVRFHGGGLVSLPPLLGIALTRPDNRRLPPNGLAPHLAA